ncbi:hypothetical protein [Salinispira pacifica]
MIQPVNDQSYQALLNNTHAASETAGEREHDGDSDDGVRMAAAQQKSSILPYSPDMGTKVNVMA